MGKLQGGALRPVTSRQSQGESQAGFLPLSQGFILGLPASDEASRRPTLCQNSSPGMKESGRLRETSRLSEPQSLEMLGRCLLLQVRKRGSTNQHQVPKAPGPLSARAWPAFRTLPTTAQSTQRWGAVFIQVDSGGGPGSHWTMHLLGWE